MYLKDKSVLSDIAKINDILRSQLPFLPRPHQFVVTASVAALPPSDVRLILDMVKAFKSFDSGNDPYNEHDFISIKYKSETYYLKIDYYDHSARIFTLMNASDW